MAAPVRVLRCVLVTTALLLGTLVPVPSVTHAEPSPRVTLSRGTGTVAVGDVIVLRGRVRGTGAANDKTIRLQQRRAGGWRDLARLRGQDDGGYRFEHRATRAGELRFRTAVWRDRKRLTTSPVRTVRIVTPPPTPPSAPPPWPPPGAPTGAPPLMQPPAPPVTEPRSSATSTLLAAHPGFLACQGVGYVWVGAPQLTYAEQDPQYTDWYVNHLWRWDPGLGQWNGIGSGPWYHRQRGEETWTIDTSTPPPAGAGYTGGWVGVTQWVFDGETGTFLPQMHAMAGNDPFCIYWKLLPPEYW